MHKLFQAHGLVQRFDCFNDGLSPAVTQAETQSAHEKRLDAALIAFIVRDGWVGDAVDADQAAIAQPQSAHGSFGGGAEVDLLMQVRMCRQLHQSAQAPYLGGWVRQRCHILIEET